MIHSVTDNLLKTIEDLANKNWSSNRRQFYRIHPTELKEDWTESFRKDFPCIVWHWEGDKIVVTGYKQVEK